MKHIRELGLFLSAFLGLGLGALTAPAQVNFWWTNTAGDAWGNNANWTNDLGGALAPFAGGSNDYALTFQNAGTAGITNNLGLPNFLLNQLAFAPGAGAVTLYADAGTSLVFSTSTGGVLPRFSNNSANGGTLNLGLVLATNTAFVGTGAGPVTVNSNITGVGSLTMGGNYTLTLNASNTYGGGTTITNGTLKTGSYWAMGTNRTITVSGAGTFDLNNFDLRTNYSVVISGAGVGGIGAIINSSAVGMQGGFTNVTLAGDASVGGANHWDVRSFSGQGAVNLNGFTLTKVGAGTLNLVGDTFTAGNIVVNGGVMSIESGSIATNAGSTITLNSGSTFYYYSTTGPNVRWPIIANGGTLQLGSGGGGAGSANSPIILQSNLTMNAAGSYVLNGVISESGGSFALSKTGNTNLVLTAANTYSGGTTNNSGWLIVSNNNALGTGALVMNGGILSNALNNATLTNAVVLAAAAPIGNSLTLTLSGPITGSGGLTLTNNSGKLYLSGANNFAGNVTLNNGGGFLILQNSLALGTNKTVLIQGNAPGQTLVLDGSAGNLALDSSLAFQTSWAAGSGAISNAAGDNVINGGITLTTGGGATLIRADGGSLTLNGTIVPNTTGRTFNLGGATRGLVNGAIQDGGGANTMGLVKQDGGLWILAGPNTYSLGTTINAAGGVLQIGNGGTNGTLGANVYTNAVSIGSGAKLAFNRADAYVVSNAISGAGQVLQNGAGWITLAGTNNTYTGGTLLNNGTLGFATTAAIGGTGGSISNNLGGALAAAGAYPNVMGWLASGRIATNSLGALALVGNSVEAVSFAGVYSNLSLGAAAGTVASYGGVYTPVANLYGAQNYNLGGGNGTLLFMTPIPSGNVTVGAPGLVQLAGSNTFSGGLTITGGEAGALLDSGWGAAGNLISVSGGALAVSGVSLQNLGLHPLNAGTFTGGVDVSSPYGAFVIATNLTGTGSLSKLGKGVLVLEGTNTYSGGTIVSNGTLRLLAGGGNNLLATNGALTVFAGTLDLAGSSQTTTSTLSFQGGVVQGGALTAPMATLDARAGLIGADLNLTGGGPLVKNGSGQLTLLGNNTFSGGTVLSNGLLAVVSDANLGGAASAITFAGGGLTILGSALANVDSHPINWNTLPAGSVLDIAASGNVFTVAGAIGGSSSLTKAGAGTLVLGGNNTLAGGLTNNGGALILTGDNSGYGGVLVNNGGTLQVGNFGASGTLGTGAVLNNGALVFARADTLGLTNSVTGTGSLTIRDGVVTYGGVGITNNQFYVADTLGQAATFNLTSGVVRINNAALGQFVVGAVNNGGAAAAGTVNMSGGLLTSASELWIGGGVSNSRGYFNLTGGSVVVSNWTVLGRSSLGAGNVGNYGELNISGGSWSNQVNNNISLGSTAGNTGRVTVTGGNLYAQNNIYVGESGVGYMAVGGTGSVQVSGIMGVGVNAGSLGSLIQTGGALNVAGEFDVGYNVNGAFGFYQLAAGSMTNASWLQAGRFGIGTIYMTGGTNVMSSSGNGLVLGNNAGTGIVYVANTLVRDAGQVGLNWAGNGRSELTIDTGAIVNVGNTGVRFNVGSGSGTSIMNLNGGVLQVGNIFKVGGIGPSILNLNGGTIRGTSSTNLIGAIPGALGLDAAYIYGGGAFIDSSNFNVTISQNLLAPPGNGVTSIPFGTPETGYVGAPDVAIIGGGGTGATAIAQFDYTSGTVTNILITSAGVGYTGTPTVALFGGGQGSNYVGLANIGANASGALTKQGGGSLVLLGSNTYTGGSVINEGLLAFASTNALGTGLVTINGAGALGMTGAYGSVAAWLTSGKVATNSSGALALGPANAAENIDFVATAGGVYSNLYVGALAPVLYTGTLGFYNNDYRLGGGGSTLAITNDLSGHTLTVGLPGTSAANTVALNGSLSFASGINVNSNAVLSLAGPVLAGAINLTNATLQVRGTTLTSLPLNPAIAGNVTLDINHAANVFTDSDNLTVGGALNKSGSGTLALGGSNNIAGNVTVAAGALRLTNGDALDGAGSNITVVSGAALQLQGGITTEAGDQLTLNGGGTAGALPNGNSSPSRSGALRNLSGSNTWRGPIVLGSVSRINADAGLLTLAGSITNNNSGTISLLGGAGNMLISGAIAGSGAWGKDGAGTVAMTASNVYTGGTYIYGGTLLLDYGAAGAPQSQIISGSSVLNMGNNYNGLQPSLLVNGPVAGTATQTFASMTINQGYSSVIASNNGGAVIVNLGTLTRNAGGYLDLAAPGGSGRITSNQGTNTSGVLTSYITVNGTDWGALGANNAMVAYTGYTTMTGANPAMPNGTQFVVRVDAGSTGNIVSGAGTNLIHNLSATDPSARTITFSGSGLLRLGGNSTGSSAGLLQAPGAGGLTVGSVPNEGLLTVGYTNNGTGELMVFNNSANALTINSALINNGSGALTVTLGGYGTGAITLAGTNNIGGRMYVTYPGITTFSGVTNTLAGLTPAGGTININSPMTLTGSLSPDLNAVVNINAPVTITGNNGLVGGNTPNSRVVINLASNLTLTGTGRLQLGIGNASASVINQTGGTFLNGGNTVIGDGTANYAAYRITGGLLTASSGGINVGWQSSGLVDLFGGAIVSSNGDFGIAVGTSPSSNQVSVVTVNGGFLGIAGTSGNLLMNKTANARSFAQLSVLSGGVDVTAGLNSRVIDLMNAGGNTGIVNLVGGSITANQIKASSAAGLSIFNFNGGSLVVSPTSSLAGTFMQGLSVANVYGGGANINTDTNNVTIMQNLVAPTGFGVSSIALANNGTGYIGAPAVLILGGSGVGATAVAQFDPALGQVTNILITSAGTGYLPTDALTLQLQGGGFLGEAVPGTIAFAPNVTTGGLTKTGTGTLTLAGTNSYGGTTFIGAGTLAMGSVATNNLYNVGGNGVLAQNGSGVTILNGSSTYAGGTLVNSGLLQFATSSAVPLNGNVTINPLGVAAFDFTGLAAAQTLTNVVSTSAGVVAFTPNTAGETFDFNAAGLSNAFLGTVNSATFGGTYTPYNGAYKLSGVRGSTLTYTNAIGGGSAVTIGNGVTAGTVLFPANNTYSGATVINTNSTLLAGAANVIGSQSAVTISSGAVFNVAGFNQSIGSLAGLGSIVNTNAKMTLTVGNNGGSTTFGGLINGAQDLVKTGSGTLTLTNYNFYTGATIVNGGTLQLSPAGTNFTGLWESWSNSPSVWVPNSLIKITTASYPRYAETNTASGYNNVTPVWPASFPSNGTVGYSGYVYNNAGSNVTWSFALNIDDGSQLVIDGNLVLSSAGNLTAATNFTFTPGAHLIDYRMQNGTGGAGSYGIFGGAFGFGYDPLGRGLNTAAGYQYPLDPGNGTLFTANGNILPAATPLYISSGATVDLNGAIQNVSLLSDYGGAGGVITNTAATNAVLQIATLFGSNSTFSGNITDSAVSNSIALWIGGSGTQVLAGTNSYHGGTVIAGGLLQFASTNAIPVFSNILINVNGALANAGAYTNVTDWLNSGRINSNSAGSLAFTPAANLTEAINMGTAGGGFYSNLYLGAAGNVAFAGTLLPVAGVTRLGGGGGTLTLVNPLTSGSVAIGGGLGTVVLSNALNNYTGTVINAGTLQIASDAALGGNIAGQTNVSWAGGGTLQAGANSITTGVSRTLAILSNVVAYVDDNGFNFTLGGNLSAPNGTLMKIGAGTTTLNGATNVIGTVIARSGTLTFGAGSSNNISSGNNSVALGLWVGYNTGDRATVNFNTANNLTNLLVGNIKVGNATNVAGAIYQSSGLVIQNGGNNNNNFAIGASGGYGYYKITGGTLLANQMEISSINSNGFGVGVMDIMGGTVSPQQYFIIGRGANGMGVVTVANGGVLQEAPNNTYGIAFGWDNNANSYGVLNILNGGYVNGANGNRAIDLGASGAGNTGILNLNAGGTAQVYSIAHAFAGTGLLNFNGGLMIASATPSPILVSNQLTAAYVYPGGANISNNANTAIMQPLLAPAGYGVTNIALVSGGANYIGAPAVKITGGSGTGATAIAQINAAGVITNILVTGYGSGYQPTDVLTVQLLGGGATAPATVGTVSLGANNNTGGLVKTGTGTLILGANNTYGGATIVNAGNLQFGNGSAAGSVAGAIIFSNTASFLAFGRPDVYTNSLAFQTPNGNLSAIVQNGSGTLVLTNTAPQYNGATVNNGLMLFASPGTVPTNATGRNSLALAAGGGVLVTNLYGSINGWLNSGLLTNNAGGGLLALTTGANAENVNWVATNGIVYGNMYLGVAPGNTATFLGTLTPVGTNYLIGGGGGTLVIGNDNAFLDANALTNRSVTFGAGSLTSGVQVLGPQNYTGGTSITNALVSVSADNNLGYGNITLLGEGGLQITNAPNFSTTKTLTFNTAAGSNYLDIATGSTATLFGAVSGTSNTRSIQKLGGGTVILSNNVMLLNNTFFMKQGTTIVDSGATLTNGQFMDVGQVAGDNATLIVRGTGQFLGAGDFNLGDIGGTGLVTVQDSANVMVNGTTLNTYVGKSGTGTLNVNGGTLSVNNLIVGNASSAIGTNNLNGGVETIRGTYITKVGGTGVFNFNGGTLRAGNNFVFSNLFTTAAVNGNPTLDSSNFTVTLNQAFTGNGTLTKQGSGTLIVNSPSNTFAGIVGSAGMLQFAGTNGMTPGRTLTIGAGAAAGYTNAASLDQTFLLRVASNSVGTVALTANNFSNLDFSAVGANLTNVSLGAFGATAWTNSGVFTNFGNTYRLGGGGGTLVLTNNNLVGPGTNLVAFGNGGTGALILTGTNTWTTTTVSGGLVRYANVAAMGANVTVATGGAVANNGALDTNLFAQLNTGSAGAFALVTNNAAGGINLGAYPSLSIGAANGSWTNDGTILPYGTTYQLGGGGGTLVITNGTLLNGPGTNLVAFSGSNSGTLVLTGTNTYDGGTWLGPLGTTTVATVSLGSGNVTNNGVLSIGSGVFTNAISGSGVLVQSAGTLTLAGANTAAGGVVVQSGANLYLSNVTGQAVSGNVTLSRTGAAAGGITTYMFASNQMGSNTVLTLIQNASASADIRFDMYGNNQVIGGLNGMSLQTGNLIVEASLDGSTNLPATLTIVTAAGSNYAYSGSTAYLRSSAGGVNSALSLVKDGAGTQLFGGPQISYNGPTMVLNGNLILSNTTAFSSPVTITGGGQLLLATPGNTTVMNQMVTNNANNGLAFTGGTSFNIGGLAGNGSISLWSQTGGGVTLNVGGNNASSLYSGTLSDVGPGNYYQGNLVKNGAGTLTLTGMNTYNGYTLLNAGILQADAGAGLSPYANVTLNGGSLASIAGLITNAVGLGPNQFNILNGGFSAVGTPTIVSLGGATSPSNLNWGTPGFAPTTFVLNETNANNALTFVNNLNLNGFNAAIGANATNPGVMATMSGVISDSVGTGSLVKRGVGTLVLAGANTYTNGTFIAGGNLAVTNDLLGVVGTPLYLTNNGALQASGNFTLNNRAVTVQTGGGKFNVDSGFTLTITNNIASTGGALTKVGAGTLLLAAGPSRSLLVNGLNVNTGTLLLTNNNLWLNNSAANIGQNVGDVGTVILGGNAIWASTNMPQNVGGPILAVGNAGRGTLIIQDNANITNRLYIANGAGSAGAVYQRSGTSVWWNGQASDGRLGMTGYGYYEITGGSSIFAGYTQIGHDFTGVGVMSQLGGTVLQTNVLGGNLSISRGGIGVYNMIGGALSVPTGIDLGNSSDNNMSNGVAIFNMMGGSALVAANINMANRSNMTLNALNLDGGVLTVNQITRSTPSNSLAFVNFNGGTLQARQNGALFNTGSGAPDGVYVYSNGATISASNYVVTVPINLQAPQGQGVTAIGLGAPALAGYMGSPYVQISGGGGTGATAYAQFDSVAGLVTGIVMTSYGFGYTSDPSVMLIGNITNTLLTLTRTANTSGSLTVTGGSGALILSGTNTYGGGTFLNGGTLLFASSNAMPAGTGTILVPYGSAFGVTNSTAASYTNIPDWLASGKIDLASSGTMALAYSTLATDPAIDLNASGYPNMAVGAFGGLTVTNAAAIAPVNGAYRLGGGWGTLALTNTDFLTDGNWLNAFPAGTGGGLQLYASNSYSGGTLIGHSLGTVQVFNAYSVGTGPVTNNGTLVFNNTVGITNQSGLISGTGSVAVGSGAQFVMLLTSNSYSGGTWLTGGNGSVYLADDNALGTGPIWVTGNNPAIASTGGATRTLANNIVLSNNVTYGTGAHWGNLVLNGNMDLGGATWTQTVNAATFVNGAVANGGIVKYGASNLTLNAANTFTNGLNIRQGTVTLGHAQALPDGNTLTMGDLAATNNTVTGFMTLDLGGNSVTLASLATVQMLGNTNSASVSNSVINLLPGQTLNINSPANTNVLQLMGGTHLQITGGGTFNVNAPNGGILISGFNGMTKYMGLDLSQLGQFSASVSNILVGYDVVGNQYQRKGQLLLAGTNTITANSMYLGWSTQSGGGDGQLVLGASNALNIANLYISYAKNSGTVMFASGLVNSSVYLNGTNGTRANLAIADLVVGTGANPSGNLVITNAGAAIYANLNQLLIGSLDATASTSGNGATGYMTFNAGTVDVNTALVGRSLSGVTQGIGAGALTVNGGVLNVNSNFVLAQRQGAGSITGTVNFAGGTANVFTDILGGGGVSYLQMNGGTLDLQGHNLGAAGAGTISNLVLNSGTLQNVGEINGGKGLVKNTAGTLVLAGVNTYTPGTTNSAGVLAMGGNNVLSTGTLFLAGGTLGVGLGGGWMETNAVNLLASSTVDTTGGNLTLSGPLGGGLYTLTKNGPNTLALSGNAAVVSNLTLNAGTLLNNDALIVSNNFQLRNTSVLTNSGVLTVLTSKLQLYNASELDNAGSITNSIGIVLNEGSGSTATNVVLNNYAGGSIAMNAGIFYGGIYGTGTVNNLGGTLALGGSASLWLGGGNAAAGVTNAIGTLNLNAGLVSFASSGNFLLGNNDTNSTGVVNLNGGILAVNRAITRGTGPGAKGYVNFNGGVLSGTVNNVTLLGTDLTAVTVQSNGAWIALASGITNTISASLADGGGNGGLTKLGGGTLLLSGNSAYTGGTLIDNGTLRLGVDGALPAATMVTVSTAGTFDVAGFKQTVGGLQGSGTVASSAGSALTVNFATVTTNQFMGRLNGQGSLLLTGGGLFNLTGTNSFSGATVVTNGSTYAVNGAHNGGLITVYGGSRVQGTGPISALNVNGGTYAPGNSIATQLVSSLTLTNASILELELGNNANDLVLVTNSLTVVGGQLKLNLAAYSFAAGSTITLVDYSTATGYNSGDPAQWFTLNDALGPNNGLVWSNGLTFAVCGGTSSTNYFQINYDGLANGLSQPSTITLTVVPEPGTASLLSLVGVAWLVRRLRRRSARG